MKLLLLAALLVGQDPAKDLKSKDFDKRFAAVVALSEDKTAEKLLLGVVKDKNEDWELWQRAAQGLANSGTPASVDALVKLALQAPVRMVRLSAARSLAQFAPQAAAEELVSKLGSAQAREALEALDWVARKAGDDKLIKAVSKCLDKPKQPELAPLAAGVLVRCSHGQAAQRLRELLAHARVDVVCAALDAAAEHPRPAQGEALSALLTRPTLSPVVERRALRALAADLEATQIALVQWRANSQAQVHARAARLVTLLASSLDASLLEPSLEAALAHASEDARAAAARALSSLASPKALPRALELLQSDKSARVRAAALQSYIQLVGKDHAALAAACGPRIAQEPDARVREQLVVALGLKECVPALEYLQAALNDAEWSVAVCAAVSMGRTQTGPAVDALAKLLKESKDWRMRGAAATGLGQSYLAGALEPLIAALNDPDKSVAATAEHFLGALTLERLGAKPEAWREWLEKNKRGLELKDPSTREQDAREQRARGTYVDRRAAKLDLTRIYQNLALFVLESRGDHIERLFDHFQIGHVRTQAGKVPTIALQPDALFVSNCTGELEAPDIERVRWFVLCGGHLFGSCWALTETIGRAFPGVLRKTETASEVLDHVEAFPASSSAYLDGVFTPDVIPIYELQGAHLIEVLEPERVEVLIDSPGCAERWGSGDLAVWFHAGHGTVLDSVNHFDVQGLELAEGLKTPEDRQAYALNHMGLSFADWRQTKQEKFWDSANKASSEIPDLSVFRLVSNFVNQWRARTGR